MSASPTSDTIDRAITDGAKVAASIPMMPTPTDVTSAAMTIAATAPVNDPNAHHATSSMIGSARSSAFRAAVALLVRKSASTAGWPVHCIRSVGSVVRSATTSRAVIARSDAKTAGSSSVRPTSASAVVPFDPSNMVSSDVPGEITTPTPCVVRTDATKRRTVARPSSLAARIGRPEITRIATSRAGESKASRSCASARADSLPRTGLVARNSR